MNNDYAIKIKGLSKCFDLRRKKGPAFLSLQRLDAMRDIVRGQLQQANSRNQLWALRDINLHVGQGEILGIIGRNGAGKSTLLKILARIHRPTTGHATIRGQVASLLEMGMGFDRELTVRENIMMSSVMNNVPQKEAAAQIELIASFAKLENELDTPLHRCSSGSYIRLAFSTVINMNADVILADEVLAVGDAAFQAECISHIRQAGETGQSVLFVSHDMSAIRQLCNRVVWLDKGHIVSQGDPNGVVEQYTEALIGKKHRKPEDIATQVEKKSCPLEGAIEHMRLVSSSEEELGALGLDSEAAVEVRVRVAPEVQSFRTHIACFHDGRIVFSISQPQETVSPGQSEYRVRMHLPAHFYNELAYEFKAALEITGGGQSRTVESDQSLSVPFYNTDPENSAWGDWPWGRPGYICPKLDWQWKILSSDASVKNKS